MQQMVVIVVRVVLAVMAVPVVQERSDLMFEVASKDMVRISEYIDTTIDISLLRTEVSPCHGCDGCTSCDGCTGCSSVDG